MGAMKWKERMGRIALPKGIYFKLWTEGIRELRLFPVQAELSQRSWDEGFGPKRKQKQKNTTVQLENEEEKRTRRNEMEERGQYCSQCWMLGSTWHAIGTFWKEKVGLIYSHQTILVNSLGTGWKKQQGMQRLILHFEANCLPGVPCRDTTPSLPSCSTSGSFLPQSWVNLQGSSSNVLLQFPEVPNALPLLQFRILQLCFFILPCSFQISELLFLHV